MALQISRYDYRGERADLEGSGHFRVDGPGVWVVFSFGGSGSEYDCPAGEAESQARMFMAAMQERESAVLIDFMKGAAR